ncbi:MAG TPA: hypothetical protein VIZ17_02180 [Acetobacteraceae bacterium]
MSPVRRLYLPLAALFALPLAASAAIPLRGIMHAWRADTRSAHDMLAGRAAFDPQIMRKVLNDYASRSSRVMAAITMSDAEARAFRAGFVRLQSDALAASGDLGQRTKLKADFARIAGDCSACHDHFRN